MALTDLTQAELEAFRPKVPEPEDFDEFWRLTLAEARALSAPPVVAPPEDVLAHVDVRDVTFSGFGGHPIKAWYARPTGVSQELPCIVEIAGYGNAEARADNHSIFGNRMRFEPEKLREIRYDNGWMRDNSWLLPWTVLPSLRRQNARLQRRGGKA